MLRVADWLFIAVIPSLTIAELAFHSLRVRPMNIRDADAAVGQIDYANNNYLHHYRDAVSNYLLKRENCALNRECSYTMKNIYPGKTPSGLPLFYSLQKPP